MSDKRTKKIACNNARKCNDVFESVDNSCEQCFKKFLKSTPECVEYSIEEKYHNCKIIYDGGGNIINTDHRPSNKVYLLDYVFGSGTIRFLKPLINMGAPHITNNIQDLFELLDDVDPDECEEGHLSKHVKHTSQAIFAALRNGWYYCESPGDDPESSSFSFVFYSTYILNIAKNKWMFKYSYQLDRYKAIIFKLLECGELVLDKNRSEIKKYLLKEYPQTHFPYKSHDDYIEEIVGELYEFVKEYNVLEIKGVVDNE